MPYAIKVKSSHNKWEVQTISSSISLLEQLQHYQIPIRSSCMGKGTCHQCRVRIENGFSRVSENDRKTFSQKELDDGWRLSCSIKPKTNLEVFLPSTYAFEEIVKIYRKPKDSWWIACDLGTTQVEIAAIDSDGVWGEVKALNRQIAMGADVMTRLEFAQRHGINLLQKRILEQLKRMLLTISCETNEIKKIFVAGNSAVTSFISNLPIDNLAISPYQPASLHSQTISSDFFKIETLPLIHSFIGGDLFAGIFKLWLDNKVNDQPWILIDIGTNSEIIFWDGQRLFVSSTPAGPAFEGSSISIGMRAENGAIINPKYIKDKWTFDVIGNDIPRGICGSALIEAIAISIENGFINSDGEMLNPFKLHFSTDLSLNQDDIREFQLAKSAIITGLELVSSESDKMPKILYLAGAFGTNLDLKSCLQIGLLPNLETAILGNLSLAGTIEWGKSACSIHNEFIDWLNRVKCPIELALRDDFQDAFIKNMKLES